MIGIEVPEYSRTLAFVSLGLALGSSMSKYAHGM